MGTAPAAHLPVMVDRVLALFASALDPPGAVLVDATLGRLTTTSDLGVALADTDFIIEAAPERVDLKLNLFAEIERLAPASAVIGSNTSALSITEMAGSLKCGARPGRPFRPRGVLAPA